MDMQIAAETTAAAPPRHTPMAPSKDEGNGKPKAAKAKANGKTAPNGKAQRREPMLEEAFMVRATIATKPMKIGEQKLARIFYQNWRAIHHSLHYITDFARIVLKGRVVRAANRAIGLYMQEKMDEARNMLQNATDRANANGITLGRPGATRDEEIPIATPTAIDVMEMTYVLDQYVVVMDSLWLHRVINDKQRDDAHTEVSQIIATLTRLLTRMRRKLINYRRERMSPKLKKTEADYEQELERIVLDVTGIDLRRMRIEEEQAAAAKEAAKDAAKAAKAAAKEAKKVPNAPKTAAANTQTEALELEPAAE